MSKKLLVDGLTIQVAEADFDDVCKMFKENVTLVDLGKSKSDNEFEQYTATTFIEKARFYLSQSPPDLVQASEKIWFAVVYAVKKLFLSLGGVDLKSDDSLEYFCQFAIDCSELPMNQTWILENCWTMAKGMHQDVYGSCNSNEYPRIITDVETFVKEFDNFDQRKLWDEFEKGFIVETEENVTVKKVTPQTVKLGGFCFKSEYSVFVY